MFQRGRYSFSTRSDFGTNRNRSMSMAPVSSGALNYKILNIIYSNLVDQILGYYSSDKFVDTPMVVQFIYKNKEVIRKSSYEMFVTFWDFAFERFFVGHSGSFVPRVELNGENLNLTQAIGLGKIIAHGFYLSGYLPVNGLCKASLLYCLTGSMPSESIILDSYLKSIEIEDREKIEDALVFINSRHIFSSKTFPKEMENDLLEFFHESDLKAIPRVDNLKELLLKSAMHYLIQKPYFVLANIRKGIVQLNPHWEQLTEDMALVFMGNCFNTGQCQPIFYESGDCTELSDVEESCNRSVRSSISSNRLFGK